MELPSQWARDPVETSKREKLSGQPGQWFHERGMCVCILHVTAEAGIVSVTWEIIHLNLLMQWSLVTQAGGKFRRRGQEIQNRSDLLLPTPKRQIPTQKRLLICLREGGGPLVMELMATAESLVSRQHVSWRDPDFDDSGPFHPPLITTLSRWAVACPSWERDLVIISLLLKSQARLSEGHPQGGDTSGF